MKFGIYNLLMHRHIMVFVLVVKVCISPYISYIFSCIEATCFNLLCICVTYLKVRTFVDNINI